MLYCILVNAEVDRQWKYWFVLPTDSKTCHFQWKSLCLRASRPLIFFFLVGGGGRGGGSGTKNLNILLADLSSIVKTQPLFMYNVRVNSNREHPPQANPGHLFYDESRGPGIWQLIVSRPPGHLQTITNLFRNIPSSFPTALRVKGFKQSNMVILE